MIFITISCILCKAKWLKRLLTTSVCSYVYTKWLLLQLGKHKMHRALAIFTACVLLTFLLTISMWLIYSFQLGKIHVILYNWLAYITFIQLPTITIKITKSFVKLQLMTTATSLILCQFLLSNILLYVEYTGLCYEFTSWCN